MAEPLPRASTIARIIKLTQRHHTACLIECTCGILVRSIVPNGLRLEVTEAVTLQKTTACSPKQEAHTLNSGARKLWEHPFDLVTVRKAVSGLANIQHQPEHTMLWKQW